MQISIEGKPCHYQNSSEVLKAFGINNLLQLLGPLFSNMILQIAYLVDVVLHICKVNISGCLPLLATPEYVCSIAPLPMPLWALTLAISMMWGMH